MKFLSKIKNLAEQFYGLLAQISTGLPQILILILISHKYDVETAGLFGIFIGYVAIIYSISFWGIRNTYVLGILSVGKECYFVLRLFFTAFAGLTTILLGLYKSIDLALIYFMIFIKSIDSLIDIDFGFNQVIDSLEAQKRMSFLNITKLLGSIFFMLMYYFDAALSNAKYSLIFFTLLLTFFVFFLTINLKLEFKLLKINDLFKILRLSTIFMFATASCSLLTNLPRISIEKMYTSDELGIAGICLSVSTLYGMAFNVNWQKYFSKYKKSQNKQALILEYRKENILLFLICLLLSVSVLPYFLSFIFNFSLSGNYFSVIKLLSSFLVFSMGMNFLNLYKLTKYKFLETLFYILTFLIFYVFTTISHANLEIHIPIFIGGLLMIAFSTIYRYYVYE